MGDRHQRFIIRVDSRQTVLVAHNIDIAKRIDELKKGDVVIFMVSMSGIPEEEFCTGHITTRKGDIRGAGSIYSSSFSFSRDIFIIFLFLSESCKF